MRAAPAVSVELGASAGWRAVQSLLWALAAGTVAAWGLARAGQPASWSWLAALGSGLLAWGLMPARASTLAWDGQQWCLHTSNFRGAVTGTTTVMVKVTVAMDLDRWMLLSLQETTATAGTAIARHRRHWLPATAAQAGVHWHGLRAALYSRAPEPPLAAAPSHGASAPD